MRLLLQAFYIKKAPSPHKVKESRIPLTKQSQADIRDPHLLLVHNRITASQLIRLSCAG